MTSRPDAPPFAPADPRVLAIDTTAGCCSVALVGEGRQAFRREPMTQGHSRHVLGMIEAVLAETGIPGSEVAAIGFGCGPGSFTGLRVACGVAQGLGLGWGRPLVPVDSLLTLSWQAHVPSPPDSPAPGSECVLAALDLRMNEVCHAIFRSADFARHADWPQPVIGPTLGSAEQALEAFQSLPPGRLRLAGDGFEVHAALKDWMHARIHDAGSGVSRSPQALQPDALAVARLAQRGLANGRAVDAADAAPFYLRDKVALDVHEQAALRAARVRAGSR